MRVSKRAWDGAVALLIAILVAALAAVPDHPDWAMRLVYGVGVLAVVLIAATIADQLVQARTERALADALIEGDEILMREVKGNLLYTEWEADHTRWLAHTTKLLEKKISPLEATRFRSLPVITGMAIPSANLQHERTRVVLNTYLANLRAVLDRYSASTN